MLTHMEFTIEITSPSDLELDWGAINTICQIERFDAVWHLVHQNENSILAILPEYNFPAISIAEAMKNEFELSKVFQNSLSSTRLENLVLWYETEITIHPLLRCIILSFENRIFMRSVNLDRIESCICIASLMDCGYSWVRYTDFTSLKKIESSSLNDWVKLHLSAIREGQQSLCSIVDYCASKNSLSLGERILIFIIESNNGITTMRIARKLGKSESTIRRMLKKLRDMKIIMSHGMGPRLYHEVLLI